MAVTKRLGRGLLTALAEGTRLSRLLFETLQPIDNCSVEFNCPSAGFLTNSSFFLFLLSLLIFFLILGWIFVCLEYSGSVLFLIHSFLSVFLTYLNFFRSPCQRIVAIVRFYLFILLFRLQLLLVGQSSRKQNNFVHKDKKKEKENAINRRCKSSIPSEATALLTSRLALNVKW